MRLDKGLIRKILIVFPSKILFIFLILFLLNDWVALAQEKKQDADQFSYLIENGAKMIRENEVEKVFNLIDGLPSEKRGDFRIRVIENFASLKAYLISKKKELGKKWQSDYKPMCYTGNKTAIPILLDLLKDDDPYLRAFVARALGYLGDHSVLEQIKRVIESDPNTKVQSRAKEAYWRITGQKFPE